MENNKVKEFLNERFGEVRTINKDGELWFVAKDICDILGTKTKDLRKLLKDKGIATIDILTNGGVQQLLCADEKSLYRMIFKSRKPFAEEFQDWIFEEVIPAIRQDGMYVNREEEMESVNEQQRKELILNGLKNLTGKETKEVLAKSLENLANFKGYFVTDGQKMSHRNNLLFPKRAILNVGMLFTPSEVAKGLRSRLLDIVHDAEEVITDNGNTIVENVVEEILDEKA